MTASANNVRPAIARIWRGRTTAAEYAGYLYEHGIKPLVEKALGVQMMREDRPGETPSSSSSCRPECRCSTSPPATATPVASPRRSDLLVRLPEAGRRAPRYRATRTGRRCRHCGKWSGLAI